MTQMDLPGFPAADLIGQADQFIAARLAMVRDDLKELRTQREALAARIRERVAQEEHLARLMSAASRTKRTRARREVPLTPPEAAPTPEPVVGEPGRRKGRRLPVAPEDVV